MIDFEHWREIIDSHSPHAKDRVFGVVYG